METTINNTMIKLFTGLDGDYHVTREDNKFVHDHEIFDMEREAEKFYNSLVTTEKANA